MAHTVPGLVLALPGLVQVPMLLSGLVTVLLSAPVAPRLLNQALSITSPAKLEVLPSIPAPSPPPHSVRMLAGLQQPRWDDGVVDGSARGLTVQHPPPPPGQPLHTCSHQHAAFFPKNFPVSPRAALTPPGNPTAGGPVSCPPPTLFFQPPQTEILGKMLHSWATSQVLEMELAVPYSSQGLCLQQSSCRHP